MGSVKMKFVPAPANDFRDFYETYFARCRALVPNIRVIAAKWTFEDLIPGLSDFDTRFVVDNAMTVDDWHEMSLAVGRVHGEMATEFKHWARNLEHLPGLNFTVGEMMHPLLSYPEFLQWTFFAGARDAIDSIETVLAAHKWSNRDEVYHLKKVATYFGPYIRGIDPPINMGVWESKYPLHSRFMHYFTPPVQAIVSLAQQRTVRGKLEALRLARETLPNPEVIDLIFHVLENHYEIPELYAEPRLTELERQLDDYLRDAWAAITAQVTLIPGSAEDTRETLAAKVNAIAIDPIELFFSSANFTRLMKGRLLFYAQEIPWFDAIWLIKNELERIVQNFCTAPLEAYALARFGTELEADQVLDRLRGNLLTEKEVDGVRKFVEVAGAPLIAGEEKAQAQAAAEIFEPVLSVYEKLNCGMLTVAESERR